MIVFDGHLFFLFAEWPTVATLPSALFNERLSLGASWVFSFSRCCHLFIGLGSISKMKAGPGDYAVTGTRRLGFWLLLSKSVFRFMQPPASTGRRCGANLLHCINDPFEGTVTAPPQYGDTCNLEVTVEGSTAYCVSTDTTSTWIIEFTRRGD